MHRFLILLTLSMLLFVAGFAQRIRITDQDGNPVAGVVIYEATLAGDKEIQLLTDTAGFIQLSKNALPRTITIRDDRFENITRKIRTTQLVKIVVTEKRNSLKETVVTGLSKPMLLQNAVANYTVIDRAAIDAIGAVTLADALPTQLNLNLNEDPMLGSGLKMQGLNSDKVKILIDGMPVNGRENGGVDLGQLNLNNVARIEIVKGPMSVVYGSDAMGGVINLISKKRTKDWDADATFNYETVGKYNINASAGRKWMRHSIALGGGRNYFNGWGDVDTNAVKRALFFKPKEQYLANVAYTYKAPSGFMAGFASDYLSEKLTNKGTLANYPYNALALDQWFFTQRSNTRLTLEHKLGKTGALRLQNSYAYYRRRRKEVVKNLEDLSETLSGATGAQDTSSFRDINLRSTYSNSWKKLQYDGGYDVLLQNANSGKFGADLQHSLNDYALYANASIDLANDKLTLQAGLRAAHNSTYNAPLTPALNVLYHPSEHMQLRLSYARAFRAPTLKELYLEFIDVNHFILGNPELQAENGHHFQASSSWQYKTRAVTGQLVGTVFYDDVSNMITLRKSDTIRANNNYTYTNVAKIRNAIFNLQADAEWKGLYLNAGAGLTHTFAAATFASYNVPEATLNARYQLRASRISISLFYKYTGETRFISQLATSDDLFSGRSRAYSLLNLSAERRFLNQRLQIIAGIKNLLDQQGGTIASTGGVHGNSGGAGILPRSLFTTLRFTL